MRIVILIFLCIVLNSSVSFSQLCNFDSKGSKTPLNSETIIVSVTKPTTQKNSGGGAILGAIGSLIGIGINAYSAHLTAKQESYAATYKGSYSGNDFMIKSTSSSGPYFLNLKEVVITRKTDPNSKPFASEIKLAIEDDGPLFRFKTTAITFNYSKARIKKGGSKGKTIDVNINVKVDVTWKKFDEKKETFELESAVVGESSIVVPGIKPDGVTMTAAFWSDWFKTIPAKDLPDSEVRGTGWYTITITVSEANPYGVTSKKIAEFFKENSETVTKIITGFIPSEEEDKKKK